MALPTGSLLAAACGGSAAAGIAWALVVWLGGRAGWGIGSTWGPGHAIAGLVAAGIVALIATMVLLALGPWKVRPLGTWMTLWLAGAVGRLILTPLAAFLVYSAAPLSATALFLGVGITYVSALLAEVSVLTRCLQRVSPV
jgi:hypothetical protein